MSLRQAASPIDIHQKGASRYRFLLRPGMSSLFGSWQLPLTLHYTAVLGRLTDIQLCVGGGLTSADDALEAIMLGAQAVQYATAILINGYGFIRKLVQDMNNLLDVLGHRSILGIHKMALENQHVDVEAGTSVFVEAKARVDLERCTACKRCLSLSFCMAIVEKEGSVYVVDSLCDGCGFCTHFCESGALVLAEFRDRDASEGEEL